MLVYRRLECHSGLPKEFMARWEIFVGPANLGTLASDEMTV